MGFYNVTFFIEPGEEMRVSAADDGDGNYPITLMIGPIKIFMSSRAQLLSLATALDKETWKLAMIEKHSEPVTSEEKALLTTEAEAGFDAALRA